MLVHIVIPKYNSDIKGFDYDDYKLLAHRIIDTYDKFIAFIKNYSDMKIDIDGKWYEVYDYIYSFPTDKDSVPTLRIYVVEYYD